MQVFAQNIQYLVGGIIIVEYLFAYPGLGKELVDAVAIRDVREVQSIAILIAAFYIVVNIVADLLVVAARAEAEDAAVRERASLRAHAAPASSASVAARARRRRRARSGRSSRRTRPTSRSGCRTSGRAREALLGTDFLGRDVLSRVLWGGRSVLALAGLATLLAYAAASRSGSPPATRARCSTRC